MHPHVAGDAADAHRPLDAAVCEYLDAAGTLHVVLLLRPHKDFAVIRREEQVLPPQHLAGRKRVRKQDFRTTYAFGVFYDVFQRAVPQPLVGHVGLGAHIYARIQAGHYSLHDLLVCSGVPHQPVMFPGVPAVQVDVDRVEAGPRQPPCLPVEVDARGEHGVYRTAFPGVRCEFLQVFPQQWVAASPDDVEAAHRRRGVNERFDFSGGQLRRELAAPVAAQPAVHAAAVCDGYGHYLRYRPARQADFYLILQCPGKFWRRYGREEKRCHHEVVPDHGGLFAHDVLLHQFHPRAHHLRKYSAGLHTYHAGPYHARFDAQAGVAHQLDYALGVTGVGLAFSRHKKQERAAWNI